MFFASTDKIFKRLHQSIPELIDSVQKNQEVLEKHSSSKEEKESGCMVIFFIGGFVAYGGFYQFYMLSPDSEKDKAVLSMVIFGFIAAFVASIVVLLSKIVNWFKEIDRRRVKKKARKNILCIVSNLKKSRVRFIDASDFQSFLIVHQSTMSKEDEKFIRAAFDLDEVEYYDVVRILYESYRSVLNCDNFFDAVFEDI